MVGGSVRGKNGLGSSRGLGKGDKRIFAFFARLAAERSRWVVLVCLVLTIPVAAGIARMEVRSGQWDLIPTGFPSTEAIKEVNRLFGGIDYSVAMVESDHLLSYPMIKKFILLEKELEREVGKENYVSVNHFLGGFVSNMLLRARQEYGIAIDDPSLILFQEAANVPDPEDPSRVIPFPQVIEKGVRMYLDDPVARKWMVEKEGSALLAEDMKRTLIRVKVNPDLSTQQRRDLAYRLESFFQDYFGGEPAAAVSVSGGISVDKDLEEYVLSSTWIMAVAAGAFLLLVLYLTFRRVTDVFLPLVVTVMTALWIYGLMGWFGLPYTVISALIGPLVLGICLENLIYMMGRFYEEYGTTRNGRRSARRAVLTAGVAVFLTSITTFFGFVSFRLSRFEAVRQFGLMCGVGLGICFLFSVTLLPALMCLREERRRTKKGESALPRGVSNFTFSRERRIDRGLEGLYRLSVRHSWAVVVTFLILLAFCGLSLPRLRTTPDLRALAPQDIPSLQAEYRHEEFFGGKQEDVILVKGDVLDPKVLVALYDFQLKLAETPYFGEENSSSLAELMYDFRRATGRVEGAPFRPTSPDEVADGLPRSREEAEADLNAIAESFGPQEGSLVTAGHDAALVSVMSGGARDNRELLAKNDALKWAAAETLGARGIEYRIGGMTPMTSDMLGDLVPTQLWSSLMALLLSAVVLVIIFRSLTYGLATLSVLVAGIGAELGFLALMGWELDMMTILIASMVIGVGIDFGIHVTHRFLEEKESADVEEAIRKSLVTVGKTIVASTVCAAGAFAIISLSKMAPIARFGAITAVSLVVSMAASLLVLPSIIYLLSGSGAVAVPEVASEKKGP
ncbi:MAG: MMPL family transporter [Candidatus Geothermincolales bacterium]